MTQPAEPTTPQAGNTGPATQPAQTPATPPAQPPWERDSTPFDQARAWSLIQNKDNDITQLKAQNAELRKYEEQVKAAEEAAKTELQRAQDAAAKFELDAKEARLALLRNEVANREGKVLPAGLADRLRGSTKEELEADADALLASLPQPAAPVPTGAPHTPVEALRPGALPAPPAQGFDDQIAAATAAGDWQLAIALKQAAAKAKQG